MRLLYSVIAMLRCGAFGALRADMIQAFRDAAADARRDGRWPYLRFCMREIGSVLAAPPRSGLDPPPSSRILAFYTAAGLAVGGAYWSATGPVYQSTATLQVVHSVAVGSLASPAHALADVSSMIDSAIRTATSRSVLRDAVHTFEGYNGQRRTLPVEDIAERMRGDIGLRRAGDTVSISFRHSDRHMAQIVCRHFAMLVIDTVLNEQRERMAQTVDFLSSQLRIAGEKLDAASRSLGPDTVTPRGLLDAGLARGQYESVSHRLAEAEVMLRLLERKQGPSLDILESPSLASRPIVPVAVPLLWGFASGLLIGLVRFIWLAAPGGDGGASSHASSGGGKLLPGHDARA